MSRPFLIGLLDAGEIEYRTAGAQDREGGLASAAAPRVLTQG
ncbi:hypothetical protein [Streptomyces thermolilacinus]